MNGTANAMQAKLVGYREQPPILPESGTEEMQKAKHFNHQTFVRALLVGLSDELFLASVSTSYGTKQRKIWFLGWLAVTWAFKPANDIAFREQVELEIRKHFVAIHDGFSGGSFFREILLP